MIDLNFVQDDALRKALEDDFREIEAAMSNGSWKSVHVLSGSIVEALLIETILSVDPSANRNKVLKYSLEEAIADAVARGIIGQMEENLSYVIKGYRNLIHPGRIIRLSERVDQETASIAISLVRLVSSKIGSEQAKRIGYTSDQVIGKISRDHRGLSISKHLIDSMSDQERIKLATTGIFSAIVDDEPNGEGFRSNVKYYGQLYRLTTPKISDFDMKKVGEFYSRVVREEPIENVFLFLENIFSINDSLKFEEKDRRLIFDYAISTYANDSASKFSLFAGFSVLPDEYLHPIIDSLYKAIVNQYDLDEIDEVISIVNAENYVDGCRTIDIYDLMNVKNESWKRSLLKGIEEGKNWNAHLHRLEKFTENATILPF